MTPSRAAQSSSTCALARDVIVACVGGAARRDRVHAKGRAIPRIADTTTIVVRGAELPPGARMSVQVAGGVVLFAAA